MRVSIAYLAALVPLVTVLAARLDAAEPLPDAAQGVAAYQAGEYERAFELLKEPADGGDLQARYLMARLLSGDLPDIRSYPVAMRYLNERARCYSPDALNLYGYLMTHLQTHSKRISYQNLLIYKEAALAGSLRAAFNLGKNIAEFYDRPFLGAAYIWEAAEAGHTPSQSIKSQILASQLAETMVAQIERVIARGPPTTRWPTLRDTDRVCRSFTIGPTAE